MTSLPSTGNRQRHLVLAAILAVYLILSVGTAFTARPDTDEAVYASPGYNLAYNGHMGTTVYQLGEHAPYSLARRTYWQPPLYFFITAVWYKLVGFSLTATRMLSVFSGIVTIGAWYVYIRRLLNSTTAGLVAAALIASDYYTLMAAGRGRMDLMSVAFGSAALAFYMAFRERRIMLAFFGSHLLAALSFLVHPGGLAWAAMLALTTLWIDRRQIRIATLLGAAIPWFICISPYIGFILLDVNSWREQVQRILYMNDNAFRPEAFSSIRWIRLLEQEVVYRYLGPFGFGLGVSFASRVKAVVLIVYIVSATGLLFWRRSREADTRRLLPVMFLVAFLIIGEASPSKFYYYLPHTTTVLAACTATFLCALSLPRKALPAILLILAVIQVTGIAVGIRQNTLSRLYKPMIDAVVKNSRPGSFIIGSGELWFDLASRRTVLHDPTLGAFGGLRPEVFVVDPQYMELHKVHARRHPDWYAHEEKMLRTSTLVYSNSYYQVYKVLPSP